MMGVKTLGQVHGRIIFASKNLDDFQISLQYNHYFVSTTWGQHPKNHLLGNVFNLEFLGQQKFKMLRKSLQNPSIPHQNIL